MFRTATANRTNTTSNNSLLFKNSKGDTSFIQPKLNIGKPGDKYEVEADRMADTIVAKGQEQSSAFFDGTSGIQTQKEEVHKSEGKENVIQEKPLVENITPLIQKQTEELPIQEKEEQEEVQKQPEEEIQKKEISEETQIQDKIGEENNISLVQQQTEEPIQEKEEQEEIQQKPEEEIQQKVEDESKQQEVVTELKTPEITEVNSTVPDVQNVEEEVQEKEEEEEEEQLQEKRFVQKVEEPDGNTASETSSIESQLNSASGGASLPKETQTQMESGFGTDFSNVRVHTDASAVQMNKDLGAQAFTHGNDIYFNEGKYDTSSDSGNHLLAHELTHTVQQGASVQPKMIQKAEETTTTPLPSSAGDPQVGLVDTSAKTITYDTVKIPGFKGKDHRGDKYNSWNLKRSKRYNSETRPSNQQQIWKNNINTQQIVTLLQQKAEKAKFQPQGGLYIFKSPARPITKGTKGKYVKRGQSHFYIGTLQEIAKAVSAPPWNRRGSGDVSMEVDHMVELQISGYPDGGGEQAHKISNMELLERRPNQQSGDFIKKSIKSKINKTLKNKETKPLLENEISNLKKTGSSSKKQKLVKQNFDLVFNAHDSKGGPRISKNKFWQQEAIEKGEHLKPVHAGDFSQLGEKGKILIFPTMVGGVGKTFKWDGKNNTPDKSNKEHTWLKPFEITSKRFSIANEPGQQPELWLGEFQIEIPESKKDTFKPMKDVVYVERIPGADFAGRLSKQSVQRSAEKLELEKASPLTVEYFDIDGNQGIVMGGKVLPTIPLISKAKLEYRLVGDDLTVFRIFDLGDFDGDAISPFVITNSNLTVELSTAKGFAISGLINFEIDKVGEGYIGASASKSGDFELEGAFNFDSKVFDPAEIKVTYKNKAWGVEGTIGIPEGKVPGVKKATITAGYKEKEFIAKGDAELDIPGVETGSLGVEYGPKGFSVEGEFALNSELPGIKSGKVKARIAQKEGAEDYDIFVSGKAKPDIPGVDSEIDITYDNGALLIQGKTKVKLEKSKADGEVTVGITNQVIGEDNKPTGEISESWSVFGSGDVSFVLTKGIVAKAKVILQPNGDILVSGGVALDRSDKKPKEKTFDKNLFKIGPPDIILFALPIGVSLTLGIEGRADLYASFMPPYFKELELSFDNFNLTKPEENTEIAGKIIVAMSGKGGVKLSLTLSATLSALIAKVTGSLIGSIGLEVNAEALAELGAKWSNQNGLEIEKGEISLEADAQFLAELKGKIRVYLDLWLAEIDIWEEELEIAKVKFGDSLKVGFKLPLSTENGELKAGEINKDSFTYPDISSDSEQQKIVEQGAKEDDKVKPPPPPSKEEAVAAVRKLDAGPVDFWNALTMDADQARALVAFNWITRDTYIMWLKLNHPKIDWSQAVAVGRKKDTVDFENFKNEIKGMSEGFFRIARVANFKEDHYLFAKSKKNEINKLMMPEEEPA